MAPEIYTRKRNQEYDAKKIDIFAFGIMMWECFTGKRPFISDEQVDNDATRVVLEIARGTRPNLKDPAIPGSNVAKLMKKCWSQNPDERPHAQDLHDKLLAIMEGRASL